MGTCKLHFLVVFALLVHGCVGADPSTQGQGGSSTAAEQPQQTSSGGSNQQPQLGLFQRVRLWYHDKICLGLTMLPTGLAKLILMVPNLQNVLVKENPPPPISCAKLVLSVEYRVTHRFSKLYSDLIEKRLPVVWVMGGPGAGKGTMCKKMEQTWNYLYFSIGDVLRQEVNKDPTAVNNRLINQLMLAGELLPPSTILVIMEKVMRERAKKGKKAILIDGFPRTLESALMFQKNIKTPDLIVYLKAKDETLRKRVLERKDGRADDNPETFEKRLEMFHEEQEEIMSHDPFAKKVVEVDADGTVDQTYELFHKTVNDEIRKRT